MRSDAQPVPLPGASFRLVWSPPRLRRPAAKTGAARRGETMTAEFVFTRADLQPVLHAIRGSLGCGDVALDSPHRLQDALRTLIRALDGRGEVTVRRSPAALLTPEYWQIDLTDLDSRTAAALRDLFTAARP
jgi:hypothetical protein